MVAKRTQRQAAPVFLPRVIAAVANDELAPEVLTTARGLAAEASEPLLVAHAVAADAGGTLAIVAPAAAPLATAPNDAATRGRIRRAGHELLEHLGVGDAEERVVLDGRPSEAIAGLAREHAGALVVCGTYARGRLAARLLGSTSRAVLDAAVDAHVALVGPRVGPGGAGQRIVCLLGTAGTSDEVVATFAGELATRLQRELVVVRGAADLSDLDVRVADAPGDLLVVGRRPAGYRREAVAALVRHAPAPVVAVSTPDAAD